MKKLLGVLALSAIVALPVQALAADSVPAGSSALVLSPVQSGVSTPARPRVRRVNALAPGAAAVAVVAVAGMGLGIAAAASNNDSAPSSPR